MDRRTLSASALVSVIAFAGLSPQAHSAPQPADKPTDSQWQLIGEQVQQLSSISFVPSLLPVLMRHRDAIELTESQLVALRAWRAQYYQPMVGAMNEIIQWRIALSRDSLNPAIEAEQLIAEQQAIFSLQAEVMRLRLSCRELIVRTFTPTQWENLAFVLEEEPAFAGLMQ
jgi:hypothetical protein